jgi:hypothetical protein
VQNSSNALGEQSGVIFEQGREFRDVCIGDGHASPSLPAELADRRAGRVVHRRRLRQLAEASDRGRVVIGLRDLARARNQRGEAHREDEPARQDDGRQPCKGAITW